MNCIKCNREIPVDSVFCPYCGEKTAEVCSACGGNLIEGSVFCRFCGTKAAQNAVVAHNKAEKARTADKFEWSVLGDGTVSIDKYVGDDEDVVIPSEMGGKKVTEIGFQAFQGCSSLTSVYIPNSVAAIGSLAFAQCGSLKAITFPDSVETIGSMAFLDCTSLTSINIPERVRNIYHSAFMGCTSLTSINLPDSVKIGKNVFYGTPLDYKYRIIDNFGEC